MKRILANCLAVLCFLAAVGIMLYPVVSSYVNEKYRSEIQTVYEEQVQQKDDSAIREAWEQAVAYNEAITPGTMESDAYSKEAILAASQDYDAMLNITGNGIMGDVEIPKLDVYLPDEVNGPLPVIFYVHGGGWCLGTKRLGALDCIIDAIKYGYAVIAPD